MRAFAQLYRALDGTTSTRRKVAQMVAYLRGAPPADAAWVVYFLAGGRPRRIVATRELRAATLTASGLPEWLFEASYQAVGDLAETMALLLPRRPAGNPPGTDDLGLADWMTQRLLPLRDQPGGQQQRAVIAWWLELDPDGRLLLNKLLTGGFRVGVSRQLVSRAIAQAFGVPATTVLQRMVGYVDKRRPPEPADFVRLTAPIGTGADDHVGHKPYPFLLAHPLGSDPALLGDIRHWQAEWKWDGIRIQLVHRAGQVSIWSRGEDLLTEALPELDELGRRLPAGTVLDGELLCWQQGQPWPMPFTAVQARIGSRRPGPKRLRESPAVMMAYDLLQLENIDFRAQPLAERLATLAALVARLGDPRLRMSAPVAARDWSQLACHRDLARERGAEGLMIKRLDAGYGAGRVREAAGGPWLKWKLDPLSIDAVLVYAQRGHGRRAGLYSDYTFAVWRTGLDDPARELVTFAKAYSGLTDGEMRAVDQIIRQTTVESFGPVRSVRPTMVFELGFEGLQRSPRHKSGIAVRFPRMLRRREDKTIEQADTLANLLALLPPGA
ncbi:MAG: ATP-dependent DNA ligase [Burkholderiaceae bacterium]